MKLERKGLKLKFNYKLTDYVDSHHLKLYIILLVSVLFTAVLVITGVKIYRYNLQQSELKKPQLYTEQDISAILESPGLTDFIIPESLESGENGLVMFREPLQFWTNEMVEHYIIDPEDLGINEIALESKKIIENKLDEIP
jgi:hypothetical protein